MVNIRYTGVICAALNAAVIIVDGDITHIQLYKTLHDSVAFGHSSLRSASVSFQSFNYDFELHFKSKNTD